MTSDGAAPTIAVVGGGITGLAAAYELAVHGGASVVLVEADDRLGGKLATTPFRGRPVDAGADAFLARVPDASDLCAELGLADTLVSPAVGSASIWRAGALRRIPPGLVLGVPVDVDTAAHSDVLSPEGWARAAQEPDLPGEPLSHDEALGAVIRRRFGDEVLERLVGPLMGGVYAGDADRTSIEASTPQLADAARSDRSMSRALSRQRDQSPPDPTAPVFLSPRDGMAALVDALAATTPAELLTSTPVTAVVESGGGWVVSTPDVDIEAHGVVIATPAAAAARLLAETAPVAADLLTGIEYASVVLVTLAYPASAVGVPLDGSGFLIPRTEGLFTTAVSWSSVKWAHLARPDGEVTLRASAGHRADPTAVTLPDDEVLSRIRADLHLTMGISPETEPLEARISRYPRGLPQYDVGHLDRVAAIEAAVAQTAPGLVVTGAAFRGLGVPACIRQGRAAARALLAQLA